MLSSQLFIPGLAGTISMPCLAFGVPIFLFVFGFVEAISVSIHVLTGCRSVCQLQGCYCSCSLSGSFVVCCGFIELRVIMRTESVSDLACTWHCWMQRFAYISFSTAMRFVTLCLHVWSVGRQFRRSVCGKGNGGDRLWEGDR